MTKRRIEIVHIKVSEIEVYPRDEGSVDSGRAIKIKIDPPIEGEALKALLDSTDIEVENEG